MARGVLVAAWRHAACRRGVPGVAAFFEQSGGDEQAAQAANILRGDDSGDSGAAPTASLEGNFQSGIG